MPTPDRAVLVIGYPLPVVQAALERAGHDGTAFNVAFAYDHEEAAHFVAQDLDAISANWTRPQRELDFLHGFVRAFERSNP